MPLPELRMSFADQAALARELDTNLRHGRAFLLGVGGVEVLADCVLVLVHPEGGREFGLGGQVVMVSDSEAFRGVGIQLRPFDPRVLDGIEKFVAGDPDAQGTAEIAPAGTAVEPTPQAETAAEGDGAGETEKAAQDGEHAGGDLLGHDLLGHDLLGEGDPDGDTLGGEEAPAHEGEPGEGALEAEESVLEGEEGDELAADRQQQQPRHERLRRLNVTQQHKLARVGELNDRVVLERLYGKHVWDGLLQNPKLTLPEVARIARKGSVPRPLIEQIVDNNAWVQSPLVRRALLSNPRVSSEGILKLLRMTPRPELKVICKTSTYSTQVREAARKVLDL